LNLPPDRDAIEAAERLAACLRGSNYQPQSPRNQRYNCFAWAARDSDRWWEPPGLAAWTYWPDGVPTWDSLENYERAFQSVGFEACDDGELEIDIEKIAIFIDDDGSPQHAARQLPSGRWTSKLGWGIDIEHELETCDGDPAFGFVARFMKRQSPGPPPPPTGAVLLP
jgi:hypothetical protein